MGNGRSPELIRLHAEKLRKRYAYYTEYKHLSKKQALKILADEEFFYKSRTDNRNIKQAMSITSKIRAWKEKRLRKKIVLRLLSNPSYNPGKGQILYLVEDIVNYINNRASVHVEE